ncbi:hypothetical protein [Bifidobacterium eulemuris]|uniref:Uncharacterized protein n=1 Tax=Bifidobacterium eulemuris TaxID=1765219 RepID=A0A261GCE5_9BIFI|nr:hypothetical protein [Bifidobacterium eulemuris]OZG69097.1 hypothetical protein BEUL_0503 [Bifidobacterium eulemuris]
MRQYNHDSSQNDNDISGILPVRERRPIPASDGFIVTELSERPVKYHIARTFHGGPNDAECHSLAMSSCRIACYATDAVRGKINVEHLHRALTSQCIDRLQTMAYLVDTHMLTHPELKARFCYLPAVPHWITGMLISDDTLETAVQLTIGRDSYLANMKLKIIGSRWMCTYADLG